MTGEIKVITRQGISRDPRYTYYPYWALKVTGEPGHEGIVELTPKFKDLKEMIIDIVKHEQKIDKERDRKPDAKKWILFLQETLEDLKQLEI